LARRGVTDGPSRVGEGMDRVGEGMGRIGGDMIEEVVMAREEVVMNREGVVTSKGGEDTVRIGDIITVVAHGIDTGQIPDIQVKGVQTMKIDGDNNSMREHPQRIVPVQSQQ
jgi:hypothetical protein